MAHGGGYPFGERLPQPDCLGGLEVDHQIELHRLLDGQIRWLRALQNPVHVSGGTLEQVGLAGSVGHQPGSDFSFIDDLSGILRASLSSPNFNFQIANPEAQRLTRVSAAQIF